MQVRLFNIKAFVNRPEHFPHHYSIQYKQARINLSFFLIIGFLKVVCNSWPIVPTTMDRMLFKRPRVAN